MIVTDGLVGYWHYKAIEGTTMKNISPNTAGQYDATISGATQLDDGLYFDGVDDLVTVADYAHSGSMTFEFYIYRLENSKSSRVIYTDSPQHALLGGGVIILPGDGELLFNFSPPTRPVDLADSGVEKNAEFHHYIVTYDASTSTQMIFVDNYVLDINTSAQNPPIFDNVRFGQGFMGLIVFARIYDRALTADEIKQNRDVGTEIGLPPPAPEIIYVSRYVISSHDGFNKSMVDFAFDRDVSEWRVNVEGVSHDTGRTAASGQYVPANTIITAEIGYTDLLNEGENRVNIYGKSLGGTWTKYEEGN